MGEQPIYSTKAHAFQIDPKTKKNWLPTSSQAVNVSYYYDSQRNSYRIISVEGSKAVINSTITPNMKFTKTSHKFGQWSDTRANTVYGLGFNSEEDLTKFIEKFKEVKELTRKEQEKYQSQNNNESSTDTPPEHDDSSSASELPNDTGGHERQNSTSSLPTSQTDAQLKYENDRLKIALAQSSANAKKWEVELQTLKNNNARLTAALQESTSNVEEWKKQLVAYKEECSKLKKKISELEQNQGDLSHIQSTQRQLLEMTDRVQLMEREKKKKEEEIEELRAKVQDLEPYEKQNKTLLDRIETTTKESEKLKTEMKKLQEDLKSATSSHKKEKQDLLQVQKQLGNKLTEIYELQDKLRLLLQS